MAIQTNDILQKLDTADKEKVDYFIQLLLEQKKYRTLKKELNTRREEIKNGDVLSHENFWKDMNV